MKQIYDDELPSFMKSTKAFEALVSVAVEPAPDTKHPKRKSTAAEHSNGEVSVMISAGRHIFLFLISPDFVVAASFY